MTEDHTTGITTTTTTATTSSSNNKNHPSIVDMMKTSNTTTTSSSLIQDAPPTTNGTSTRLPQHTTTTTTILQEEEGSDTSDPHKTTVVFPSALVGSIVGTRSASGTMVELKGTGSFDVMALSSSSSSAPLVEVVEEDTVVSSPPHGNSGGRLRAQTAPSVLSSGDREVVVSPTIATTTTTTNATSTTITSSPTPTFVATSNTTDKTTATTTTTNPDGSYNSATDSNSNNDMMSTTITTNNNNNDSTNNTSLNQTASYCGADEDDDDEDIRRAMAMALAIQNHPHLTPHEIHELLGTTAPQSSVLLSNSRPKPTKTVPTTTASSLLSSFTTAAAAATSSSSSTSSSIKPSRFTQMFSSFATTTAATTTGTTPVSHTSSTSNNNNNNISNAADGDRTMTTNANSTFTTNTTTSETTTANVMPPPLPPIEEISSIAATSTNKVVTTEPTMSSSSGMTPSTTPNVLGLSSQIPRGLTVSTTITTTTDDARLPSPTMIDTLTTTASHATTMNDVVIPTTTVTNNGSHTTIPSHELPTTTATSSTIPTVTTNTTPSAAATATISPSFSKQISQRSAMLFKSGSRNTNMSHSVTGSGGSVPSATALPLPLKSSLPSPSVRISGIAWKRRGGMGKYSSSHAWERRRIELVGTKLLYYIMDENDDTTTNVNPTADDTSHHSRSVVDPNALDTPTTSIGNITGRKGTWLESTGMNFTSSISSALGVTEGMNNKEPRGFLDLAKEKATVHAAFGHSGAPTPFAISIKVRAETKWKLCFDRHSIEMDWLAAISDVVIQCSVDAYNGYLLEAADPANHSDFTLFHPPAIKDGPALTKAGASTPTTTSTAIMGSSTQHRLWMLEDYNVSNVSHIADVRNDESFPVLPYMDDKATERDMTGRTGDDVFYKTETKNIGEDMAGTENTTSAEVVATQVYETTTTIDHDMIQDTILSESNQHWVVPQDKLPYILLIVNLALFYARASSTSITGFWSMFVGTNFGILWCFVKEPTWQSLVDLINSAPTTTTAKSTLSATNSKLTTRSATIPELNSKIASIEVNHETINPSSDSSVQKTSGYVPAAGSTCVHLKDPSDIPQNAKGETFAGWCNVPGEILAIRSHGYAVTKKKVPSPGELYECIHLEVFESPQRYPDMAKRVQLPKVEFDDDVQLKTWRCPDLFIISIALPTDPPRMGKASSDGGGYTITMYYRMKAETREILRRVTADGYDPSSEVIKEDEIQTSKVNAVRLLEEWIRRAPTDHKFQSRFKIVPNAHNLKEIGMPSWISKYNGKPFLIKRPGVTGFLFAHPELSCVEFDVSLHPFPYLAKQAICFMKESYFKKVLVSFGFVIEGRADDEVRGFI